MTGIRIRRQRFTFGAAAILMAATLLAFGGCQSNEHPELRPAGGVVTYKGEPVAGATVAFHHDDAARLATGTTDEEGLFQLTSYERNDGAIPGEHRVVITKADAWAPTLWPDWQGLEDPIRDAKGIAGLDTELVHEVSAKLRTILAKLAPEFVNAAEGFAEKVTYIPVSALGRPPEEDPETGMLGVRPSEVVPVWAEVPLLYLLNQTSTGLIPSVRRRQNYFD